MKNTTEPKTEEASEVQLVISNVPKSLADDIDELAKLDQRKRAPYLRKLLAEIVAAKKSERSPAKAA